MTIQSVASAKCRPGHILLVGSAYSVLPDEKACFFAHLLPNPKTEDSNGSSFILPSDVKKRSGLNASGSGYVSGSCNMAL